MLTSKMRRALLPALVAASVVSGQVDKTTPGWFEFDMPGLAAAAGTPVDMSGMNAEPAGKHGFVRIEDGHFVDGRGRRLRLFGTNVTGDSCFPEPDESRRLAVRLRQLGFNCLRLHFMDFSWGGETRESLWANPETGALDEAESMRKLDRLVAECAANGIYINLNLHVGRVYPGTPQMPGDRTFRFGKSVDRWYEPFIVMQETFARAMLDRTNTVTGVRWADDPAVCCIEINNENTMIRDQRAVYRKLGEPFASAFANLWTEWLRRKYRSTEALRAAWGRDVQPLGEEMLTPDGWSVENAQGSESTLTKEADVWRWVATKSGQSSWNLQMQFKSLRLAPRRYTLTCRARSRTSNVVGQTLMLDRDPWTTVGLRARHDLTPEWQAFSTTTEVVAPPVDGPLRVNLSLSNKLGDVEFADFSLRPGGGRGLPEGQSLATGVGIPDDDLATDAQTDWFRFLIDTETRTTRRLVRFLKKDLGCKAPISDTQISYGSAGGVLREAELTDYTDIHGYWEHPHYQRNEKGWVTSFKIPNTTQVASSSGTLCGNALYRLADRPFSVSEYNTPAPNDHGAELFPLFATMAAVQDWDALYSYTYRDFGKAYEDTQILRYFHLIGRANVLVHAPACARLFRGQLLPANAEVTQLTLPRSRVAEFAQAHSRLGTLWAKHGLDAGSAWLRRIALRLGDADTPAVENPLPLPEGPRQRGAVRWHPSDKRGAWFSVNAPAVRLLIGHVGGRTFKLGDASVAVSARPWPRDLPAYACISLVALDGKPVAHSAQLLLAASARTENPNMAWNEERTSLVGKKAWGEGTPVSEAVPLTLTVPGRPVVAQALGADGRIRHRIRTDGNTITLREDDRTLWALIERR